MFICNLPTIMRMAFSSESLKLLVRTHDLYKTDPEYSPVKLLRAMFTASKGEKVVRFGKTFVLTSFLPPIPSRAFLSVLEASREGHHPFSAQATAGRSAPISFFLALTSDCSYSCFHCSARNSKAGRQLSVGEWIRVVREIQDMGTAVIGFTGGEPLLRLDLEKIIGAVDDRSSTILYTSGAGLTPERAEALKAAGLFAVGISLDSADESLHDEKRGVRGAFTGALEAIGASRAAGLYTMVQTMVPASELSGKDLFRLFRLAGDCGAHEVRILEPIPSGALLGSSTAAGGMFYTDADRKKLISIQYAANRRPRMPKVTTFAHTESGAKYGCGAGTQHSFITASGDLQPCDFVPLSFGNVGEKPVAELWRSMNDAMGNPKSGCFAVTLNERLKMKTPDELPVPPPEAETICRENRQEGFPEFYRRLQGRK